MAATGGDMVTHWLGQAGRVPMLTPAEELHLGALVRAWQDWEPTPDDAPPAVRRRGLRARDRMVTANLRLVAHVTRKARPGLGVHIPDADLPDLLQAGAIGLQRGVEKFDPARGYKISTFCYWWIRQGLSRHVDWHGRTIRVSTGKTELLARARRTAAALTTELGRAPTRAELAMVLDVNQAELEHLLLVSAGCHSLEASLPGDRDGSPSTLGDLTAAAEPEPDHEADELRERLAALDPIEQRLITGRWGLDGPPRTLAQLASQEAISVGEVRKMLANAMGKLRKEAPPSETGLAAVQPATPGPIPRASVHVVQLALL